MKLFSSSIDLVEDYLNQNDWKVNENSNTGYSLQGLNNFISSEVSKYYWLKKLYPKEICDAHNNGDFHIHDLGLLGVYCVGWDLQDLLIEGFKGVKGKTESKPPKHFRSALIQIVNFFYTLQGEAAGAQAFSNFDTLLAPFIYYDNLDEKEVKQSLQEFIFNLNVSTRVGFQTPFTNITLDLTPPSYLADTSVIIGGQPQDKTYKEFQNEMNILNKVFLEVMEEGDAKGRIFTFPIPTYNITKDFDWNNKTIEKLWSATAKYGFPYFANFVNSDMSPEDARSMCCRLRLDKRELKKRNGGLFGASPLTGSIGVVTINMPRIGYLATNELNFFNRLDNLLELAKQSLEIKRKTIEKYTDMSLYPYSKFYLRNIKSRFNQYWKNHFSTIGLVGMNEACLNLFGENIASDKGKDFTKQVLDFMRDKIIQFQDATGNMYNLEATPAESTSYRLAKKDKDEYPDIICANEDGEESYYTNSTNLPIDFTHDIFEVLDLQNDIQTKYTGGTVVHIFLGEKISNIESLKSLIKSICMKYEIPYFTITPTFSICPNCGYIAGEQHVCEKCQSECEVYSRIVGYFRAIQQWNKGKKEEFKKRKTFQLK